MSTRHPLPLPFSRRLHVCAAALLATLAAGCMRPLAFQDEFFAPTSGSAARVSSEAWHAVRHHRAWQVAHQSCASAPPAASQPGADLESAAGRGAPVDGLCGTRPPAAAVHGGISNAYGRWTEDRVRELPEQSQTAASAAGGS